MLNEYEIKIYETFYREQSIELPLFVRCPKISEDYAYWVGFCQECGLDH